MLITAPASALTIDFEEFGHGEIVTSSQGVVISTTNIGGGPDIGVAFDTNRTGTADRDLQRNAGWQSGNLAPDTDLGNILIIQEHRYSCNAGTCSDPDDEGSRPAGSIEFDYSAIGTFDHFEMDLIDIEESISAEPGAIDFYLGAVHVEQVMFSDFGTPGVIYGDNSANHLYILDGITFDRVKVSLGGSGGIDNLIATNAIPEPTAAILFIAGLAAVHPRIRRRS